MLHLKKSACCLRSLFSNSILLSVRPDLDPESLGRSDDEIVCDAARVEVQGHSDREGEPGGAPAVRLSHEERPVGFAQQNFQRQVPAMYQIVMKKSGLLELL